ncbi:MAG: hypothetical protein HQM02_03715, partial [Magnetococcales bacterium]|nr:hypothetical protein [Magnetococcales bacterium]
MTQPFSNIFAPGSIPELPGHGFFPEQMDYIYFIYGLSFLMLSVICLTMPKEEREPISWHFLGSFGLVHGVAEWLELATMVTGDTPVLYGARLLLHSASFLFLAELALRGVAWHRGRAHVPGFSLAALALTGALSRITGMESFPALIRYGIAFPACATIAWLMWRGLSHATRRQTFWMRVCGFAMLGYGVSSGMVVPPADIWPATLLNSEIFQLRTGFPIQLIRALLAFILTVSIWNVATDQPDSSPLFQKQRRYFSLFISGFLLLLGGGWILTEVLGGLYQTDQAKELRVNLDALVNRLNREMYAVDGGVIALAGITHALLEQQPLTRTQQEAADLAVDQLAESVQGVAYLLDTSGTGMAASNRGTSASFVGQNYRFRPYFQQAMEGGNGRYFAYGVTSREPGYYASAPVYAKGRQRIIGVAVIKKTLLAGELGFQQFPEVFLLNPDGVALLSGKEAFPPQPLWPLPPSTLTRLEASKQFGPLSPTTHLFKQALTDNLRLTMHNQRYLVGRVGIQQDGWSVLMLKQEKTARVNRMLGIFISLLFALLMLTYYLLLHRETTVLHTARRMAEVASQTKSSFLANMSHEIRT